MSATTRRPRCCRRTPRDARHVRRGDGVWLVDDAGRALPRLRGGNRGRRRSVTATRRRSPPRTRSSTGSGTRRTSTARSLAELAARLSERFGGAQAFFCNSGAEANEAALKYARKATGKPGVVALERSFHGRTTGALSVTGQPAKRAAFEPLVPGVRFAQPNDVESLRAAAARRRRAGPARAGSR